MIYLERTAEVLSQPIPLLIDGSPNIPEDIGQYFVLMIKITFLNIPITARKRL